MVHSIRIQCLSRPRSRPRSRRAARPRSRPCSRRALAHALTRALAAPHGCVAAQHGQGCCSRRRVLGSGRASVEMFVVSSADGCGYQGRGSWGRTVPAMAEISGVNALAGEILGDEG
jgi:hypothetical protein